MAIKNIRKTRKNITRKTKRSRSKVNSRKLSKVMKGGDAGRYVLPPSYFNSDNKDGYYAEGSPELLSGGKQHAVSQGSVWENGEYAGPNLYPTIKMNGGGGCNSRRNSKKSKSKRSKSKSKRSKSIKHMKGGYTNCTKERTA